MLKMKKRLKNSKRKLEKKKVKKINANALRSGSALVIIAHPDDEIIWMGGTIMQNRNINWTIVSLCRGDDEDRAPKFKKVCKYLNARSIITNIEDDDIMTIKQSIPIISKMLIKHLPKEHFSYVFTHGYSGEYGHLRHKGVYRSVKDLIRKKKISVSHFVTFAYHPSNLNGILALPAEVSTGNIHNNLPNKIFKEKQYIMNTIYGFNKKTPDYKSAGKVEAFTILKQNRL